MTSEQHIGRLIHLFEEYNKAKCESPYVTGQPHREYMEYRLELFVSQLNSYIDRRIDNRLEKLAHERSGT